MDDETDRGLTQENFERLLAWLHEDRDEAGKVYEDIRSELISRFRSHHCSRTEALADKTIDRVAKKLGELTQPYEGDPRPYVFRVAFYVRLEESRKAIEVPDLPGDLTAPEADEDIEPEFACLDKCMASLSPDNRDLVLKYYQGEKRVKINLRKELAASLNLTVPALRLKAQRIRMRLKECIKVCLAAKSQLQNAIPRLGNNDSFIELES